MLFVPGFDAFLQTGVTLLGVLCCHAIQVAENEAERKPDHDGTEGYLPEDADDTVYLLIPDSIFNTLHS